MADFHRRRREASDQSANALFEKKVVEIVAISQERPMRNLHFPVPLTGALDFSKLSADTRFKISQVQTLTFVPGNLTELRGLNILTQLRELRVTDQLLDFIEIPKHLTNLRNLNCQSNGLTSITITPSSLLQLNVANNQLTKLEVNAMSRLEVLHCENNRLTQLDASRCCKMRLLNCSHQAPAFYLIPPNCEQLTTRAQHIQPGSEVVFMDDTIIRRKWTVKKMIGADVFIQTTEGLHSLPKNTQLDKSGTSALKLAKASSVVLFSGSLHDNNMLDIEITNIQPDEEPVLTALDVATLDVAQDMGEKVEYQVALNMYFAKKREYEDYVSAARRKIWKNEVQSREGSIRRARQLVDEFVPKCIACDQPGGTIFKSDPDTRKYHAMCGAFRNKCPFHIELYRSGPFYDGVAGLREYQVALEARKQSLICVKQDIFFGYVDKLTGTRQADKLLAAIDELTQAIKTDAELLDKSFDLVARKDGRLRAERTINEVIAQNEPLLLRSPTDNNHTLVADEVDEEEEDRVRDARLRLVVNAEVNVMAPSVNRLRNLKWDIMAMETEEISEQKSFRWLNQVETDPRKKEMNDDAEPPAVLKYIV